MIKRTLKISLISSLLTLATFSASASLNMTNNSSIGIIKVTCGSRPGIPIAKGRVFSPLTWHQVKEILGGKLTGTCEFSNFNTSKLLGSASLEISPDEKTAAITQLQLAADSNIKVSLNAGIGEKKSDISATITDL